MQYRDPVGAHRRAGVPVVGATWSDEWIQDEDVTEVVFQDCAFERVRFEGVIFEQAMFVRCRFDDCIFEGCQISDTRWIDCKGTGFSVAGGVLSGALLSQCALSCIDLQQAGRRLILSESRLDRLTLQGAAREQQDLTISGCVFGVVEAEHASWNGASAVEVDLTVWKLDQAQFERCSFIRASGNDVDFSTARFDTCNLYQSALARARFRRAERTIFAECDLAEADLVEGQFAGALFAKSSAPGARFERAVLDGALFPNAILTGASFAGAAAAQSVWTEADLTGADLQGIQAFRSTFRNAVLDDARVTNAYLVEADLHGVKASLDGANLDDSRGTISWRAERETELNSR